MCVCTAGSFCWTGDANNAVKQLYTNKDSLKINNKRSNRKEAGTEETGGCGLGSWSIKSAGAEGRAGGGACQVLEHQSAGLGLYTLGRPEGSEAETGVGWTSDLECYSGFRVETGSGSTAREETP